MTLLLLRLCLMVLVSLLGPAEQAPAEESAENESAVVCDLTKPHASANYCNNHPWETKEIEDCCNATCLKCHPFHTDEPDLAGPTEWNGRGVVLAEVYIELAATENEGLADLCFNCHVERFLEKENHPVEIVYAPDVVEADFIEKPDGPYLVCETDEGGGQENCLLRCVTCHQLHAVDSEGNEVAGLLRVTSEHSALCLRCHNR